MNNIVKVMIIQLNFMKYQVIYLNIYKYKEKDHKNFLNKENYYLLINILKDQ